MQISNILFWGKIWKRKGQRKVEDGFALKMNGAIAGRKMMKTPSTNSEKQRRWGQNLEALCEWSINGMWTIAWEMALLGPKYHTETWLRAGTKWMKAKHEWLQQKVKDKKTSTDSEGQWSWGQNLVDLLFSLPLTPGGDVPEQFSLKMIPQNIWYWW